MNLDTLVAFSYLSDNQRQVAIDRFILDRTPTEVASAMGVARSTVYMWEDQARERLRGLLADGSGFLRVFC